MNNLAEWMTFNIKSAHLIYCPELERGIRLRSVLEFTTTLNDATGIQCNLFSAFWGKKNVLQSDAVWAVNSRKKNMGYGQVSLYINHLLIMARIAAGDEGYHCIFESDVALDPIKLFGTPPPPPGHHLLYLDYTDLSEFERNQQIRRHGWHTPAMPLRTHAMIVHSDLAKSIISQTHHLNMPIDWFLPIFCGGVQIQFPHHGNPYITKSNANSTCKHNFCALRPSPFFFKFMGSNIIDPKTNQNI